MSTAAVSVSNDENQPGNPPPDAPKEKTHSVRRLALSGATYVALGFGAGQIIKLVSSVILTRLIHPEVYGLMDLAMSCMVAIHLFSDLGIHVCVVQSKRGEEPSFLRTAWTINIIRNGLLAIVAAIIAWPIARLYNRPILLYALPVIGTLGLIEALNALGGFVLNRRVQRGRLVLLETLAQLFTLLLTVLVVYVMRPGPFMQVWRHERPSLGLDEQLIWATILGGLFARFLVMLLSHLILPGPRSKLELDRDSAKEMMGFAKWVFVSTILTFIGTQIDRFFVPKLAGFEAAGLYGRALGLLGITTAILSTFNSSVIYPIFGRLQAEGRSIADYYPRIHQILSILGALLMSGLVATGPSIARLLYPAEYGAVGWLLQIFAFGAWFQMIQDFIGSGLLASGRRRAFVLPSAIKAAAMLLLLVPSWWLGKRLGYGDLVGIAVGWLAINVVTYVSAIYLARASGIHVWKTDFPMAAILVASSVAGLKLGKLMSSLLGTAAPNTRWGWFAQLLVMGTSTLVIWAAFLVFAWRRGTFDMLKRSRA